MLKEVDKQTGQLDLPQTGGLFGKGLIPDWLESVYYRSVTPVVSLLATRKVNPNWISGAGFIAIAVAGWYLIMGRFYLASAFVILGGFLDSIDGTVAARTNRVTRFGAIYDSVLDRYSDTVVFISLAICFHRQAHSLSALIAVLALVGSFMTSYIMAVGRSQGVNFRAGFLRRQERMTIVSVALLFSFLDTPLKAWLGGSWGHLQMAPNLTVAAAIWFIAVFSNITAVQRLLKLKEMTLER